MNAQVDEEGRRREARVAWIGRSTERSQELGSERHGTHPPRARKEHEVDVCSQRYDLRRTRVVVMVRDTPRAGAREKGGPAVLGEDVAGATTDEGEVARVGDVQAI